MISLFFVICYAFILLGLGASVVAVLDRDRNLAAVERIPVMVLLGGIVAASLVWAVGAFRYDMASMAVTGCVLAALALPGLRRASAELRTACGTAGTAISNDRLLLFFAASCALLVVIALVSGLAPPADYDSLNYHLSLARMDLERGWVAPNLEHAIYSFMPMQMELQYRLALALVGSSGAQMISTLYGATAAAGVVATAIRVGATPRVAALAALMFLGVRNVIWEMATCYVDVGLAAYLVAAMLLLVVWSRTPSLRGGVMIGLLVGAQINIKYHGLPLAALLLAGGGLVTVLAPREEWRQRAIHLLWGGLAAVAVVAPLLIRNMIDTGNPVFPLFGQVFGTITGFTDLDRSAGRGFSVTDFLLMPWDITMWGTRFFDGQQLGAPYLLAFAPLAVLARQRLEGMRLILLVLVGYAAVWFWYLSQQIRFLMPVVPLLCICAALGAGEMFARARAAGRMWLGGAVILGLVLVATQTLFLGGYAMTRLPAALGRTDAYHYLVMQNLETRETLYGPCLYLEKHLQPGEHYLNLVFPSYYCPQMPAVFGISDGDSGVLIGGDDPRVYGRDETLDRLTARNVRYVLIRVTSDEELPPQIRAISHELKGLRPVYGDSKDEIYDLSSLIRRQAP